MAAFVRVTMHEVNGSALSGAGGDECTAASLLTRPDDSSQLHYILESASFCLGSERRGKNK